MRKKLYICAIVVFAAVFLVSGFMLIRQFAAEKQSADAFVEIAEMIVDTPEAESQKAEAPNQNAAASPADTDTREERQPLTASEKYAAVYAQNPDFVGWIRIDDTKVNYPVMQTPDSPNYYLRRAFDKSYSTYGVPYVQENCDLAQSDNVIIYGHNMKSGAMFADLCKYESQDFYDAHKIIHFDTLAGYGEYEILAVFKTVADDQTGFSYHKFVNAENEAAFDDFVAQCKSLAFYDTGVSAEYGDKLITLSTCEYSRTEGRLVVVAKQVDPENP